MGALVLVLAYVATNALISPMIRLHPTVSSLAGWSLEVEVTNLQSHFLSLGAQMADSGLAVSK
jgi:hypothetical protein